LERLALQDNRSSVVLYFDLDQMEEIRWCLMLTACGACHRRGRNETILSLPFHCPAPPAAPWALSPRPHGQSSRREQPAQLSDAPRQKLEEGY
jgi:hypothetical protein